MCVINPWAWSPSGEGLLCSEEAFIHGGEFVFEGDSHLMFPTVTDSFIFNFGPVSSMLDRFWARMFDSVSAPQHWWDALQFYFFKPVNVCFFLGNPRSALGPRTTRLHTYTNDVLMSAMEDGLLDDGGCSVFESTLPTENLLGKMKAKRSLSTAIWDPTVSFFKDELCYHLSFSKNIINNRFQLVC